MSRVLHLQVTYCILEVSEEEEPILEDEASLGRVDDGYVVLDRPLLQLPQQLLSLLVCAIRQQVLEFLDYYINGLLIPSLMKIFIDVDGNECEVLIVTHQPRLPKHLYLELSITVY